MKRTADELALAVLNALNIEATDVFEFTIHAEVGRPLRVDLVKWVLEPDRVIMTANCDLAVVDKQVES